MNMLLVAPLSRLLTHTRFFVTLRSDEGAYHSLILFRLATESYLDGPEDSVEPGATSATACASASNHAQASSSSKSRQIYVMEASCPHLGADMSHADIEEYGEEDDMTVVAVCPWHRYDFDLRTGKSEMGMQTCTYAIEVKAEGDVQKVYMETPLDGNGWRLVELRPVSEEFADPPLRAVDAQDSATLHASNLDEQPLVPLENPPSTLMEWAVLILNTPDPRLKVERTRHAVQLYRTGQLKSIGNKVAHPPTPPDVPPRHALYVSNTIEPGKMKSRKNLAATLHALANIEQWAIDLAWDIIARFGPKHRDLPPAFFTDFTKMALDESKHFTLLTSRLSAISPSTPYGSFPVHAALWESAAVSADSFRARLAIIHLVHEARGLDVNPATIERFRRANDHESVAAMEIIHADEVTHVTSGHRWFTWICARDGVKDPVAAFREEVRRGWRGDVKGPFNSVDREKAGLTPDFYCDLKGELGVERPRGKESAVQIGYEVDGAH
ncbi:DUF455-domain-containing protein [Schizophyllum amplum]|uniref:DUF455-domain-containing protein n=1 Tax=Schizophyllum amplum TaxID=97359 RepID=A0A550CPR4_9AGAR|nr:DUF455-domain-containing protein [Auriculariopsis ampla]